MMALEDQQRSKSSPASSVGSPSSSGSRGSTGSVDSYLSRSCCSYYMSLEHCDALRDNVERCRVDGGFADIVVVVGKRQFSCHRVILAAGAPYFRSMFSSGMEECHKNKIELKEVEADVFEYTLRFIYTGQVNITGNIAPELFTQAHMFQIAALVELCVKFFKENITDANCLGALTLADIHGHRPLFDFVKNFACSHFTSLIDEDDFLKLSLDCIVAILRDRHLNCISEDIVYNSAVKWLEHDPESRRKHKYKVLECIKFPLIKENYLMDTIVRSPHVSGDDRIRDLLEDAVTFHTIPSRRNMITAYQITPRYSFPFFESAVLLGGRLSDGLSNDVEWYRSDKNEFLPMKRLPFKKRNEFGVCAISNQIYVSGGLRSSEFWKFDTIFETWNRGANMTHARRRHAMVAVDNDIYILGGFDEECVLDSVEKWDNKANTWDEVGNLIHSVENMGYVAFGRKIYLFGGKNNDEQVTNIVQVYDTTTNTCTVIHKGLPANDMCLSAAVLNNHIYIVGLEGVFRFSPASETWETLPDMTTPRDFISLATLEEKLFAIGGRRRGAKDNLYSDNINCFDPMTNTWKDVANLPVPMYCYGCVKVFLFDKEKEESVATEGSI